MSDTSQAWVEAGMKSEADENAALATVTVQRSAEGGIVDLTVMFVDGSIDTVLDEDGNAVTLNKNERLMATCLFNAGVDETGR